MAEYVNSSKSGTQFNGNEIVISGISGIFPDSENTYELGDKLFNKIDMVKKITNYDDLKHLELPKYSGKIKGMEKFDAQFFRVPVHHATTMDPSGRKILEHAYAAFFDAGVNPETLKGSKIGVYIGSATSDVGNLTMYNKLQHNAYIMPGLNKALYANRISYWMDSKGSSLHVDSGCTASMSALEMAYQGMRDGIFDSALVGGCNFCVHPVINTHMKRAGLICLDGKTKCFDKNGDGYVRSDAITVYFLQRAKDAKRVYAELVHVKGKFFSNPQHSILLSRIPKDIERFFEEFYSEIDVSPKEVEYIEANAAGVAEADGNELEAIANFFSKDRIVKVGSVKSNMGNTEAVSGSCSIVKMCLSYQRGEIPANLHYNEPQNQISAIKEGKLQVVTENKSFNRGYTAINNFGFNGSNYHALLKGHYIPKDLELQKTSIARLVLVSGRKENCVNKILNILETNSIDAEQIALINDFFRIDVPGHTGRGFIILDSDEGKNTVRIERSFEFYSGTTRPVWFLYTGMGSQWAGMGEDLMRIPVFAAAIQRCQNVLQAKGLDIVKIITDKNIANLNILNSFIGITAVQIGLTDVMTSIGIIPDNIIGHSLGEIASAYADGSLTAEEAFLSSYARAIVSYETEFIKGKMAAVGLGHKDVDPLCPLDIEVVCHNSSESCTISGPANSVTLFVENLTAQGIFARVVASSNIAFHSRYIAKCGDGYIFLPFGVETLGPWGPNAWQLYKELSKRLIERANDQRAGAYLSQRISIAIQRELDMLKLLKEVIPTPKRRSKKWVSTSHLPEEWQKLESQYASPEYFTHNLVNKVYFEEAAKFIPDDAIIIEIAPHGLLQAIMKRSHANCLNVSLTKRGTTDSVNFLLKTIGKLYQNGLNPDINALYPKVNFPVSSETPVLAHLIDWDHSEDWIYDNFRLEDNKMLTTREFIFSIQDDDYNFLQNHIRYGDNVLSEAAILIFVWETLATFKGVDYRQLPVVFETVKFHNEISIKPDEVLKFKISILLASQKFEVVHKDSVIATGIISAIDKTAKKCFPISFSHNDMHLNQNDIYTLLSTKGYSHEGLFKGIKSTNIERNKSVILWNNNWITFLDSMIQFFALSRGHDGVSQVKLINKLTINTRSHNLYKSTTKDDIHFYNAEIFKDMEQTRCGGVIIDDLFFDDVPKKEVIPEVLQTRKFMPHYPNSDVDLYTALDVNLQILNENISGNVIKIKEIMHDEESTLANKIILLSKRIPPLKIEIDSTDYNLNEKVNYNKDLLIVHNLFTGKEVAQNLIKAMNTNSFILAIENRINTIPALKHMELVTVMNVVNQTIILMKKTEEINTNDISVISTDSNYSVSSKTLEYEIKTVKRVVLVVEKSPHFCIQGIMKEVKKYKNVILFVTDAASPKFSITNNYFVKQIQKGLKINLLKDGQWGSCCYISASAQHSNEQNFKLIAKEKGNLESLAWIEAPSSLKNVVQVSYAGLSMKDFKKICQHDESLTFGMDFSGIDSTGARVMGLLPEGAMASTVEADKDLLWPVPAHWSLKEAATVPLPYVHALYCLYIRTSLHKNSTVFVNGAAGALGQAAISIALGEKCTVFAAVGNIEKKKFLLKLFPELDENNIGNTYDITFRDMILTRTKGKGCDIIINCGNGMISENAMNCGDLDSILMYINDDDWKENKLFGMYHLSRARSYKVVNLSNIFSQKFHGNKKVLHQLLIKGIASGSVRPLTSVEYTPADITRAFQLLSIRNNRGRVLVNMKDPVLLNDNFRITPRITLSPTKVYIVVCDGTELSIELIDRLVQRGARCLILNFSPKSMNGYFHVKYASWSKLGVRVEFNSLDLQVKSNCVTLIRKSNKLGSICDGIFIANSEISKEVTNINEPDNIDLALVVSNLDLASHQCGDLRYFAVISTTSRDNINTHAFDEIEKCTIIRNENGLGSLFLRFVLQEKKLQATSFSLLFNAMEASLKLNYVSVFTSDERNYHLGHSEISTITGLKNKSGLGVFLNQIMRDEFSASEPIVWMKTKYASIEHEIACDPDETHVIMIPGIEGNFDILNIAAERLKKPAIALQFSSIVQESVPELAKTLLKHIKSTFNLKSPFYLMGYSLGVNIALEMAALLEREGLVGVVYCLDSSPDAMRVHLDAHICNLTDEQLQNALVEHFYKLLANQESSELKEKLQATLYWSDKIELFLHKIKCHVSLNHKYLSDLLQATFKRLKMAREYKPKFSLESELVLIKGIPHPNAAEISDDYNLSQYTNKPVQVFTLESDHASAPFDCRVSNYMNRTLLS